MSKPMLLALVVGTMAVAGGPIGLSSANAADLPVPVERGAAHWCGPCGCLHTTYEHHRELKATYGIGFDPRSYDQTEPHYYLGAVRAYPRYWVSAE